MSNFIHMPVELIAGRFQIKNGHLAGDMDGGLLVLCIGVARLVC